MSATSLPWSMAAAHEARAVSTYSSVRLVDSCEGLPVGMYEWRVGEMTDPNVIPSFFRRLAFILQRSKAHVPSGKLPTSRGGLMTREMAEWACEDEFDFVYREPLGALYRKGKGTPPENFCRPLWEPHEELNQSERVKFAHEAAYFRADGLPAVLVPLRVSQRCQEVLDRLEEVEQGVESLAERMERLEGRGGVDDLHLNADDATLP